ncbi:MAG: hypothetical protein ACI92E_002404, partial [Oceanicoccus sp.]
MVYHRRRDIRFFVSENVGVNNRILNRQTEPSYDQLSSQLDLWF